MMDYSILMSVYYKENPEYLRQAIESMLNQTIKSNDFVIVCDGKLTDEHYEVLDFYESNLNNCIHRLQLDKNYGLGIALNKGLEVCRNELVARMDSDDIALPNRIEKQLKEFEKDTNLTLCGAYVEEFNDNPGDTKVIKKVPITNEEIRKYIKKRNPFNHMTVVFKKTDIKECGSYEHCYLNEDYYLWAKVIAKGHHAVNIPEILVNMRVGNGMYERRGGLKYAKADIILQLNMLRLKITSFLCFFYNVSIRVIVRLVPNSIRKIIYLKYLRK
ncbi:MAG: glycosyltransferase [Thomasclavelia sp.]